MGDLADPLLEPRLAPLPGLAAETIERHPFVLAAEAREHVEVFDRDVELVAPRIGQRHAIVGRLAHRDRLQPLIAPDAVAHVDHQIARGERREFGEEGVGVFALLLAAHQPVAEDVLLGDQFQLGIGETGFERQNGRHRCRIGCHAQRRLPALCQQRRWGCRFAQNGANPRAAALRIGGDDGLPARLGDRMQMLRRRLVDIVPPRPFGGEVAGAGEGEIDDALAFGLGEQVGAVDRPIGEVLVQFLAGEIERGGFERAIAAGRLAGSICARSVIVGNVAQPLLGGPQGAAVDQHQVVAAEVVEQGAQPLLEQRQPVLHPRQPPPVAHRLIERIAGGIGAEQLAVAAAETLDAVLVEQRLAGREQQMFAHAAGGTLGIGIEQAQRLELVAKKIEPQARFQPRGVNVEDRAAHREFAGIGHRIGARIALALEQLDQALAANLHTRFEQADGLSDAKRRDGALQQSVDRGDQQLRDFGCVLKAVERCQPPGADREGGAGAVIGQAVPGGEFDDVEFGGEVGGGLGDSAHRGIVGGDENGAGLRRAGEVGEDERLRAPGEAGEGEGGFGGKDSVEVGHGEGRP